MMKKYGLSMLLAFAMSFAMNITTAAETKDVHGLWKLVGHEVEVQSSDEKMQMMGMQPKGYVLFMPEGRVFFLFAGETAGRTYSITHRALERLSLAGLLQAPQSKSLVQRALDSVTDELVGAA